MRLDHHNAGMASAAAPTATPPRPPPSVDGKLPVTILTGFLGSGKTTLLNYILKGKHGWKIAVIENEYGDVGIDDELVSRQFQSTEEIFEMNNGCICCTVRGDLIRIVGKLIRRKTPLDAIVIETTGLADPGPVAQSFFMDETIKAKTRLDGIVTVVDAKHIVQHLDEEKEAGTVNEAIQQIAFADFILINKTDLVSPATVATVRTRCRAINRVAEMEDTVRSECDLAKVLGISSFNLDRVLEIDPEFLMAEEEEAHSHDHGHEHTGDDCTDASHDHAAHAHDDGAAAAADGAAAPAPTKKHKHKHDTSVSSVGFILPGECNMSALNAWMGTLLQDKGADLYRMKGVLAVQGMENKYVFHGVHMTFDGSAHEVCWKADEEKVNKLVFIGKDLDKAKLIADFKEILV